jgi:hypothetical protein
MSSCGNVQDVAILGFLTGFGLSAAIGAVLYVCLAAG